MVRILVILGPEACGSRAEAVGRYRGLRRVPGPADGRLVLVVIYLPWQCHMEPKPLATGVRRLAQQTHSTDRPHSSRLGLRRAAGDKRPWSRPPGAQPCGSPAGPRARGGRVHRRTSDGPRRTSAWLRPCRQRRYWTHVGFRHGTALAGATASATGRLRRRRSSVAARAIASIARSVSVARARARSRRRRGWPRRGVATRAAECPTGRAAARRWRGPSSSSLGRSSWNPHRCWTARGARARRRRPRAVVAEPDRGAVDRVRHRERAE